MLKKLLKRSSEVFALLPPRPFIAFPSPPGTDEWRDGAKRGWGLEHGNLLESVLRDPLYRHAVSYARGRSIVDVRRRANLFLLVRFFFQDLKAHNIIELGTWRGGNVLFFAALLRELYPEARVFGLDTFEGMPPTVKGLDCHEAGDFSDTNYSDVCRAAEKYGLDNVTFVKGDVRETLETVPNDTRFGLAHIDLDIYEPIVFSQRMLLDRLVEGGYLVYDDATTSSCPGATLAVEEMIASGMRSEQIWPHFVFRGVS